MFSRNELNQQFISCRLSIEVEILPARPATYSLDKNLTVNRPSNA